MALGITVATILDNKTAAANASTVLTDCTAVDGAALVALGFDVVMTFEAAATLGATIKVFSSRNGTNFTTLPIQEYDVAAPGSTTPVRVGFVVLPGHAYYRVQVTNLSPSTYGITAISVYAEQQALS